MTDHLVHSLFEVVFPKIGLNKPMKPQIQARRAVHHSTGNIFGDRDLMLILAISELPAGYDFEALFQYAKTENVTVLVLQAVPFEIMLEGSFHVFSLELTASVPKPLAALFLGAAVADIRYLAETLN